MNLYKALISVDMGKHKDKAKKRKHEDSDSADNDSGTFLIFVIATELSKAQASQPTCSSFIIKPATTLNEQRVVTSHPLRRHWSEDDGRGSTQKMKRR